MKTAQNGWIWQFKRFHTRSIIKSRQTTTKFHSRSWKIFLKIVCIKCLTTAYNSGKMITVRWWLCSNAHWGGNLQPLVNVSLSQWTKEDTQSILARRLRQRYSRHLYDTIERVPHLWLVGYQKHRHTLTYKAALCLRWWVKPTGEKPSSTFLVEWN